MSTIRVRRKIDSDTLHLPELGAFIGHTVDILIEDEPGIMPASSSPTPGVGDWDKVLKDARNLIDYDFEALHDQDARDRADSQASSR